MSKQQIIKHNCKVHGETDHYLSGTRKRCKQCNVDNVTALRKKRKAEAIEYKGGKCECCGYDKYIGALEFHHRDPSQKDFGLSHKGMTRSWDKMVDELDKCIMVCANCHREIHAGLIQI